MQSKLKSINPYIKIPFRLLFPPIPGKLPVSVVPMTHQHAPAQWLQSKTSPKKRIGNTGCHDKLSNPMAMEWDGRNHLIMSTCSLRWAESKGIEWFSRSRQRGWNWEGGEGMRRQHQDRVVTSLTKILTGIGCHHHTLRDAPVGNAYGALTPARPTARAPLLPPSLSLSLSPPSSLRTGHGRVPGIPKGRAEELVPGLRGVGPRPIPSPVYATGSMTCCDRRTLDWTSSSAHVTGLMGFTSTRENSEERAEEGEHHRYNCHRA